MHMSGLDPSVRLNEFVGHLKTFKKFDIIYMKDEERKVIWNGSREIL